MEEMKDTVQEQPVAADEAQAPAVAAEETQAAAENAGAAPAQARENREARAPRENREPRPFRSGPRKRRKVCQFCQDKIEKVDYKDVARLRKHISERSKILPRRVTGACAVHQRQLTVAIKRARQVALLPYISD